MQTIAACALIASLVGVAASAQTNAVLFDIDGTLTPSVTAISTPRIGAADAATAFADAGVQIVYVTARIRLFQSGVPDWLSEHGFPDGALHLTQTRADRRDHQAFKTRVLQTYTQDGVTFVAAFGDSSTDFAAYSAAGIPTDRIYALQRSGDDACQSGVWQGCYTGWDALRPVIDSLIAP